MSTRPGKSYESGSLGPGLASSTWTALLVATDGREQSDGAVRAGALYGDATSAWRLVSATPFVHSFAPEIDWGITAEATEVLRDTQRELVERQIQRALGVSPRIEIEIATGGAAEVIAAVAARENASLVICGLGRHNIVDRLLGDETALAIIRASTRPVLAVPSDFAHAARSAVVGIDFSEASIRAARLCLRLIRDAATVYLLNVSPPENVLSMATGGFATYEARARAELDSIASHLDVPPRMHVQAQVRQGDPGSELLQYAEQADAQLISVGTRGHGLMARLLMGSVATKVVRASPLPVLTIPAVDEALSERRVAEPNRGSNG